ncbi:restriction endonuclease subunit S [Streptomyces scabiei]|uniref:restriction endonuclease subunit S n=1 Tax=Streptomyces scabiei TaxID=1930 RepID=UPI001B30BEF1|nr:MULTISPECIES: restriction endonuclease subunit S [Streptomyces]MDW8476000.1 restriction endonuclease subunit S [Streptomyces scabiei]MDX2569095.1 restriction endonuclease subunit S [Streptomyces scabiei]MDX2627695.1 restriction endonuclease subunit S [Streptomyces scabiei]MDX3149546.1 restriction endonuclease subunit S [Streptomyces scabiei]MDX3158450.1 restriction endonuclease subunit S [Streptomyces scabiei]
MTLGLGSDSGDDGEELPGGGGGELPQGWARATLAELCDINPRAFDDEPGDDDFISQVPMASVEAETGRIDASNHVRYGDLKKKSLTRFQENDVLFAKITPCMENGKIAVARGLLDGRALGSTEFHVLRSCGAALPEYLMHYLLQPDVRTNAEQNMSGAVGQRRVPRPYLESLSVPVPPLAEQRRIVGEVEQQIAHIEAGEAAAHAALSSATSLAEQITTRGSRGCLKEVELAPAPLEKADIDDGTIPDLPADWSWARLGEVAAVVGGVTKDSKRQGDPNYVEVPYLRVANVQRGQLVLDNVTTIRVPPEKALSLRLQPGDILLNEGGDRDKLGRGWVWEGQVENCIHQNHVFRARVIGQRIHPKLLAWHANGFGKAWCDRNGTQSVNLASISLRKIKLLPVPIPPQEIQEDLVKTIELHLEGVATARVTAEAALTQARDLRAALLNAAFTGTLVPQNPADEPASTLLDRIRAARATAQAAPRKRTPRKPRTAPPGQEELPQ